MEPCGIASVLQATLQGEVAGKIKGLGEISFFLEGEVYRGHVALIKKKKGGMKSNPGFSK